MTVLSAVAGFLSGVIGAMGLGGGGVLLIYLTVFASVDQLTAQGINLLFFLPVGAFALITYAIKKQIKWKNVLWIWAGGIPGAICGFFTANYLDSRSLSKLFACFLIIFGLSMLFSRSKKEKNDV